MANADDLYGQEALALLAGHLGAPATRPAPWSASACATPVVGEAPVTRGVCQVDDEGLLAPIDERRQVFAVGGRPLRGQGRARAAELDGDALVSMNLWGFTPAMRGVFERAMAAATDASEDAEVLLPEVVGELLAGDRPGAATRPPPSRCWPPPAAASA